MLIKKNGRPVRTMQNTQQGGVGELLLHDITTPESLPKNLRVLSIITLKTGEAVGHHTHHGESEIYHCLSGEGLAFDMGQEVMITPGDTVVTPNGEAHGIRNTGLDDLVVLAVVVHE